MDSQPPLDDHLADIVDDEWRQEQLPHEQIWVPSEKLPDPEADNGDSHLTLLEQEQRWTDLSLANLTPELTMTDQINISSS
ncbi:anaphase-promoting complex subunit 13 [Sitodiplosis mosellana]|uniref:anaphase-promoting complex subunit 13 n=1 Tax=Sitodiplosis mosellana TaxID=263140 RepID=UPI002443E88E|nr:anaphase-promoting complex subunit 13 [Sitodiplosis mosellana]